MKSSKDIRLARFPFFLCFFFQNPIEKRETKRKEKRRSLLQSSKASFYYVTHPCKHTVHTPTHPQTNTFSFQGGKSIQIPWLCAFVPYNNRPIIEMLHYYIIPTMRLIHLFCKRGVHIWLFSFPFLVNFFNWVFLPSIFYLSQVSVFHVIHSLSPIRALNYFFSESDAHL